MRLQYKLNIPVIIIIAVGISIIVFGISSFIKSALFQQEFLKIDEEVKGNINQYLSEENFSDPSSQVSQEQFLNFSERIKDSTVARFTLWNKDRVIIFSDLAPIIGYSSPDQPDLARLFDTNTSFFITKPKDTNKPVQSNAGEFLDIYIPISINGKVLGAVEVQAVDEAVIRPIAKQLNDFLYLMIIGSIGFLLVIVFLQSRVIIYPLRDLVSVAKAVFSGDLTRRAKVRSSDELGYLARIFNQMLDSIQKSQNEITAANQQLRASEQQLQATNQQLRASEQQLQASNQQLIVASQRLEEEKNTLDVRVKGRTKELSEERSKILSLIESIKLGVIMCDLKLNIILVNKAARSVLGKSESEDIAFKDLDEKMKDGMEISQVVSSYIHTGKLFNLHEITIGDRYFQLYVSLVRDISEKFFIGAVIIIDDITEQKQLEKMRTEIVSITSHQLRTPLSVVKGNLEMILDGDFGTVPTQQKEILREAFLGNERMIRLVNDLMDARKIEEGKFELKLETVQPKEFALEAVENLLPFAHGYNVSLSFVKSSAKLPKIKIDSQKIRQVLQNLIENAVKYSCNRKNGKIVVKIKKDKQFLNFIVKDNGIGIPKEEQGKLYDRFFRGSNATKLDPGGGTGLGLYIAKAIIEQNGGKIWFESEEGKGTTFYIAFPILPNKV